MYVIPLIVIILIALTIFFSPILAVALLVLALIALGAYKFFGPGTEPEHGPPAGRVAEPPPEHPNARAKRGP